MPTHTEKRVLQTLAFRLPCAPGEGRQAALILLPTNEPWRKDGKNILAEPPVDVEGPQAKVKAQASVSSLEPMGNLA